MCQEDVAGVDFSPLYRRSVKAMHGEGTRTVSGGWLVHVL